MKSHCFPFRQVPHSSKLFLDYLDFSPSVQPFYPRSPRFLEWAKEESDRIQYPADRRSQVATILERQNRSLGSLGNHSRKYKPAAFWRVCNRHRPASRTFWWAGLFDLQSIECGETGSRGSEAGNRCRSNLLACHRRSRLRRSEPGPNAGRRRQTRDSGQRRAEQSLTRR